MYGAIMCAERTSKDSLHNPSAVHRGAQCFRRCQCGLWTGPATTSARPLGCPAVHCYLVHCKKRPSQIRFIVPPTILYFNFQEVWHGSQACLEIWSFGCTNWIGPGLFLGQAPEQTIQQIPVGKRLKNLRHKASYPWAV